MQLVTLDDSENFYKYSQSRLRFFDVNTTRGPRGARSNSVRADIRKYLHPFLLGLNCSMRSRGDLNIYNSLCLG